MWGQGVEFLRDFFIAHLKTITFHLVERKQIDDAGDRSNAVDIIKIRMVDGTSNFSACVSYW